MVDQEQKRALRKAMYEDVDVLFDFYTNNWEEDAFEEAKEAVPGITQEEFDEYRKEDSALINGVVNIATKASADEDFRNKVLDENMEKAYEAASPVAGKILSFEDFKDFREYGGKPFLKTFEGLSLENLDDELSEDELDEVAGGIDDETTKMILKTLQKVLKTLGRCFVADSLVETPRGSVPIQDIKVGDVVCSLDRDNNMVESKVTELTHGEEKIVEVHFANGKKWETTPSQWFYNGNKFYHIWQHKGQDVITLDGATKITDIVETDRKEAVYDMVLDGTNVLFINGQAAEGYGS